MMKLYHAPLCPFSRLLRVLLFEKNIPFELSTEPLWEDDLSLLVRNPARDFPLLTLRDGHTLTGVYAILEYIAEQFGHGSMFPKDAKERAETRRLTQWFCETFHAGIVKPFMHEKVTKRFLAFREGGGAPDMAVVRRCMAAFDDQMEYISYLVNLRYGLVGEELTLADFAASAQISCLDYLTQLHWEQYPKAKYWYARLKSRPCFKPILEDYVIRVPPSKIYAELDF